MPNTVTPEILPGQGKSSFDLIDPAKLWSALDLNEGITFLDLGCGAGNYSLAAAEIIGPVGQVYAVDLWEEGIAALEERIDQEGRTNIKAIRAPVSEIPLADHSVDVGFMATVLHDLMEAGSAVGALAELTRVVKPEGILAIAEFEKVDQSPGPPLHVRLAPEDVERFVTPFGFSRQKMKKIGAQIYLTTFVKL